MVDASAAGISPHEFYRLTLGEIYVAIEGYHERERQSLISRINSILRALSKKGDPYKGLGLRGDQGEPTLKQAVKSWLWNKD